MPNARLPVPGRQGYRWPAEWAPHEATWLAWPKNRTTWPSRLEEATEAWAAMAGALAPGERVEILADDAAMESAARNFLTSRGISLSNVRFHRVPTDDAWMRDSGPIFIAASSATGIALTCWKFNGWGEKKACGQDTYVPGAIRNILGLPAFAPTFVLEGGSIDGDGEGTLLTSEQCLLHPNRGANRAKPDVERTLMDFLGVSKVLWMGNGIAGDDTDGHVDDFARFVAPGVVVACEEKDPDDENHAPLKDNLERLRKATDAAGRLLQVVPIPMPPPLLSDAGVRLPASHANFYVGNAAVLVPFFGGPTDAIALGILRPLFPGRRIVGIDCRALVIGGGAIHCVTQQQPAG
mgnify:CR=1 FL=1